MIPFFHFCVLDFSLYAYIMIRYFYLPMMKEDDIYDYNLLSQMSSAL